ncbi:MAG: 30S ribosomal protein S2 [Bacteroidetes bacterium QH_7_64_110]|nr:MAG: 30S ribosomal protein S2 [Bacteroidetes bacterium QH_7_64_110]
MADETSTQDPDVRDEDAAQATEAPSSEESPDDASPPEADQESPSATAEPEAADAEADAQPQETTETDEATPETEDTTDEDQADEEAQADEEQEESSHRVTVEELLKAGAHFGHLTSRWNPRMEKYIFMERNNIHIIDLMQTQVLLDKAADAARRFAKRGKKILFAGTKTQAQDIVREHAEECGMPHMVDRWLGGTMTNFQTIRKSIRRMEEIERMDRDGTLDKLKKKEKLMRMREHEKLEDTLGGIRDMANLPGAIYIVDVEREDIAVSEANNLGIPIIAMVDTNGNPKNIDHPIPVNDDALSSIELVTSTLTDAIKKGLQERKMEKEAKKKAA